MTSIIKEIEFDNKDDAYGILDQLSDIIQEIGYATYADYLDIFGISNNATACHLGWYSLTEAYVEHNNDTYQLILPKLIYLS